MTKHEEKSRLSTFIADLPSDSYLRSILGEIQPDIDSAISNDFGFVSWADRVSEQRAYRAECEALVAREAELKRSVNELQRVKNQLVDQLDNMTKETRGALNNALNVLGKYAK